MGEPLPPHQRNAIEWCIRYLRTNDMEPSEMQVQWAWEGVLALAASPSRAPSPETPSEPLEIGPLWQMVEDLHDAVACCARSGATDIGERWKLVNERRRALSTALAALLREREELRTALTFYANSTHWRRPASVEFDGEIIHYGSPAEADGGDCARAALAASLPQQREGGQP